MIEHFLSEAGWGSATRAPLAGDASTRRYTRLTDGGRRAILMEDRDPKSLTAFRQIGKHLRGLDLSAPAEFAADPVNGLLLIEDFGVETFADLLAYDPATAKTAYETTVAMLPRLAKGRPPDLSTPAPDDMAQMVGLTFDLLPQSDDLRARLLPALAEALELNAPGPPVLSLRDVHAENLIWLPERDGDARVGLLDFQDAIMLPAGYDLASLLDDPRRVVPQEWRTNLVEDIHRIDILSLQRNLRILGIFHRLATQFGKPRYRKFLPRTRALLMRASEPFPTLCAPVSELLDRTTDWTAS